MKGNGITIAIILTSIIVSVGFLPGVMADSGGSINCERVDSSSYDLVLECFDSIDVNVSTMNYMYEDFEMFSKSFEDARVYNVQREGQTTYATLEIPLPVVSDLKSDIKFTKSNSYTLEFLNGKLEYSKLVVSLESIGGYDGTPNGASLVHFDFKIKENPCFGVWPLKKCASFDDFAYALDRGLYVMEPIAKEIQADLSKKMEHTQEEQRKNDQKPELPENDKQQVDLKGPPLIDTDNDGIPDSEDFCKTYKEIYNGYHDLDGCPDVKTGYKPIPASFVKPDKGPYHYIERYNTDSDFKGWFDENLAKYDSIYEAVGLDVSSIVQSPKDHKLNHIQEDDEQSPKEYPKTEEVPKQEESFLDDFDKDSIADADDTCPKQPEVYNGYIDWDGCPDTESGQIKVTLDDDNDGVMNHLDQCPNMKETRNGFKDNDGCPDAILETPEDYEPSRLESAETVKPIPNWVKNNAKWYSVGSITDRDFAQGIKHMIKEDIVKLPYSEYDAKSTFSVGKIPEWVKTNAGWWADGKITDKEFVESIQFMLDSGIINIE